MSHLSAVLWDVDGTMAETERDGHRIAFNRAFADAGLDWHWDVSRYGELLRVTGGRERILHDLQTRGDAPTLGDEREALARRLHQAKNRHYADLLAREGMPLRPGVTEMLSEVRTQGLLLGIVTTTSRANVDALLRLHLGADWARQFDVCICGEDVQAKKPHPEAYLHALTALRLSPLQAVAMEDSPGGVAAACAAGLPVVVTRSEYFSRATLEGAVAIGPGLHCRDGWRPAAGAASADLGRITLDDVRSWVSQGDTVSQHGDLDV